MKRIVTHNLPVMGNSSTVKLSIEERSVELAHYIIESKDTVRGAAKKFGISKSTVHTDLSERLKEIDKKLGAEIDDIFKNHDKEKHIRGGEVTRQKYKRG